MAKQANLINYPKLNDKGGDLSKTWYVGYSFRLPTDPQTYKFRVNICSGSPEERYAEAASIIETLQDYLKSGEYLNHPGNYQPVRAKDKYRPEHQLFTQVDESLRVGNFINQYIQTVEPRLRPKTVMDYRSKLKYFAQYIEEKQGNKPINRINRQDIMLFFNWLIQERNICRRTAEKHGQAIRALFEYAEDMEVREYNTNPCRKLPKVGKVIDCAHVPFDQDDRERLKAVISVKEPMLWLACEIQYYCAIRPGTELRLCKVGMIDRKRKQITIPAELAKNKTTESVGIPDNLMKEMERLGIFNYPADYYIFGKPGIPSPMPLGKNTMRNRFNLYREQLGIDKTKTFYSWKHTGAISAANNNMPIMELKDYLRHKDIATTMEYLKNRAPKIGAQAAYIDAL